MALKECPECGKEVSTEAKNCPNCGAPLKTTNPVGCLTVIAGIILLILISSLFDKDKLDNSPPTPSTPSRASVDPDKVRQDEQLLKERAEAFNSICSSSMSNFSRYYEGVSQRGHTITFFVNDSWLGLSRDNREVVIKGLYTLWFTMGRVRGLEEDPSDYAILVKHYNSHRTLAKWGAFFGYRETPN